jgi:hypothetical protein
LIAKDKANAGAAAALVASVPTTFVYDMTFSSVSGSNGMWQLNNSTARISVADSFDILGGLPNIIKNAIPFASANDPRVPVINGDVATPKTVAEDQVTAVLRRTLRRVSSIRLCWRQASMRVL